MERAILDSCVLWPSAQRDFLLQLAAEGGFEAAWSKEILNEVRRNERKKLARPGGVAPGVAMARADKLIRNMRGAFPRAEVTGYEYREGRYRLPDPKDEHVVAAATLAGIATIVTENRTHFPARRVPEGPGVPPEIEIVSARAFAGRVVRENPAQALKAVEQIAKRSGRQGPKMSVDDVIGQLEQRYKMAEVASVLRQARGSHEASASSAQPVAQQQRQTERPRTPRLRRDLTEQRGGHRDRGRDGRDGREGPRTR